MTERDYNPKVYNNNELKDKVGIYQIRNTVNNKIYIGSAVNLKKRFNTHLNKLKTNIHENSKLQRAFDKYGEQNFIFEIIEFVEDKNKLLEHEQYWIDRFNIVKEGYNICPTAGNSLGRVVKQETRDKMSKNNARYWKGKKVPEHVRQNLIKSLKSRTGSKNSKAVSVINLQDNNIFGSEVECAEYYKISTKTIREHCKHKVLKPRFAYYLDTK